MRDPLRKGGVMEASELRTRAQVQQRLSARASEDGEFRARLKSEPKVAIADELGIEIPEGVAVEVLEEEPGKIYLVLPADESQLNDADLERVSGGEFPLPPGYGPGR
jgi:hypothetical protein